MVKIKLMPVANGIISEKLFNDNALNMARAENTIRPKARIKGILSNKLNHSFTVTSVLPFNCHLIKAAPDTLKEAYNKMYTMVFIIKADILHQL